MKAGVSSYSRSRGLFAGEIVTRAGGQVVHEAIIPEIAYHGTLVDIPAAEVHRLIEHEAVSLALADDVMFLRPQTTLRDHWRLSQALMWRWRTAEHSLRREKGR